VVTCHIFHGEVARKKRTCCVDEIIRVTVHKRNEKMTVDLQIRFLNLAYT